MKWDEHIQKFKADLKHLQQEHAYSTRLNVLCLNYVAQVQKQLKQDFKAISDLQETEEIYFFKHIKPIVSAHNLFYRKIIQIEHEKPVKGLKTQIKFYKKQFDIEYRFKLRHKAFAYYLKSKQTHLDAIYFTRREPLPYDPDDLRLQYNPNYSTPRDFLSAKLAAATLLTEYLKTKITQLVDRPVAVPDTPHLDWSGSRTDLIELTYALYHAKVIHKGKADIIEIARALANFFNMDPGDVYKTYSEIKSRKKSRTKFLDEMTMNLTLAMDREDF
ncbi:RteC domain-containing protein [Leeuwenhoekiella parthenopeia]|uniref:RteC domain-containing protein n=1 Tax=Leeuwenhoekiella parthenopeia TaxID=2890320 RepID=A0ABS8GWP0_9FLAO|nr:RteC domain-containing protein [Leeuwenhoekiella parthenopeia]MCC4214414.1 RteC domain-containing protein [Leeuwenhoekiella parthenopeia]